MGLAVDGQFRYTKYTYEEVFSLLISRAARTGVDVKYADAGQGRLITIHARLKGGDEDAGGEEWIEDDRVAVVLGRSSDWYKYRLNVYAQKFAGVQWIVAGTHDTCVPVPVWCVEDERLYSAYETRISFNDLLQKYEQLRYTAFGHRLILGGMICNLPEAREVAKTLKKSARYALEADVRKHTHMKKGRPLKLGPSPA
jgi:hypothetical protein